jgi:hypothetical protein
LSTCAKSWRSERISAVLQSHVLGSHPSQHKRAKPSVRDSRCPFVPGCSVRVRDAPSGPDRKETRPKRLKFPIDF